MLPNNETTPSSKQRSCLYECTVMHHRLLPKQDPFSYRIFMFSLDLDELDAVTARTLGFSRNRFNLYNFRDADHLGLTSGGVREAARKSLAEQGITLPAEARIQLITLPRVLGYIFNPVSFYFCFSAVGEPLCAIVEVGNTFGEKKLYYIREPDAAGAFYLRAPKHFYVSPFTDLDVDFEFKLRVPGERMEIHINDRAGDRPILLSTLSGRQIPLTSGSLARLTLKYPFITLKVIFLIHWHALLLWKKKLPFHRKTANPHLQQDVIPPKSASTAPPP